MVGVFSWCDIGSTAQNKSHWRHSCRSGRQRRTLGRQETIEQGRLDVPASTGWVSFSTQSVIVIMCRTALLAKKVAVSWAGLPIYPTI